jgi:SAM-dependent methyltransferase
MTEFTVSRDASVYYAGGYWNDLPQVAAYLNRRVSGHPAVPWWEHLRRRTGTATFGKALFLNCGNGWVERELVAAGAVAEAVGVDVSASLIAQARAAAGDLPIRYYERDLNAADIPEDGYGLVVNHAAAHHLAYVDRVFRRLCEELPPDGVFVSHDYVGAHRNQYAYAEWSACWDLNESLPERFQQKPLRYPYLPDMLAEDPTEAIHSELVLETARRYFDLAEVTPIGGALAYPLLTFNAAVHSADDAERDAVVDRVLSADQAYTDAHPDSAPFAFFWGTPRKSVLSDTDSLARWTAEEDAREAAAAANGGHYYPLTALQAMAQELERVREYGQYVRPGASPGAPDALMLRRVLIGESERRWPRVVKALVKAKRLGR